jgi:hypothetical protein
MRRVFIAFAFLAAFGQIRSYGDIYANLSQDWSNSSNPNTGAYGTWSLNQGSTPLSFVNNWAGTTDGLSGWGPSANVTGDFLPFWFQVSPSDGQGDGYGPNGTVIMHPTDFSNGGGNGTANASWSDPVVGSQSAFITGSFWATPTRTITSRLQDYELVLNPGANQQILIPWTQLNLALYTQSNPLQFSLTQSLTQGDVVDLLFQPDNGGLGTALGLNLTIDVTPEPPAYGLALFFLGAFGLWKFCRRTPQMA